MTVPQKPPTITLETPAAAWLWHAEADLFEKLKRRLVSYSANSQRALAADWRAWRAWCLENGRVAFPAWPMDIVDYILAHSPPLRRTPTGELTMDLEAQTPAIRRASTVARDHAGSQCAGTEGTPALG